MTRALAPRALAKARSRRRTRDRGAVMFIVAMTLAIIAAMGIYALNVAATEIKTAGYVREQTQTYYLSDYGVMASTQEVLGPKAQMYRDLMISKPDTNCTSLFGTPNTAGPLPLACRRVGATELASQWNPPATLIQPYVSSATEDSRGTGGIATAPDFYIELSDPNQKSGPSGYDGNQGLCFIEFTVTSVGLTQLTTNAYTTEGHQTSRGRIIGGPIKCF